VTATALTIADLPDLPAEGLDEADLVEIERPQPGDTPNANYRLTAARLRAALDPAAIGDLRLALTAPGPDWLEQGTIAAQAEYPELFGLVGLTGQSAPPGEVWEAFAPTVAGGVHGGGNSLHWAGGQVLLAYHHWKTIARSTDGGQHWQIHSYSSPVYFQGLGRVAAAGGGVVYNVNNQIYRSPDAGLTWVETTAPFPGYGTANVLVFTPQRLVAFQGTGSWAEDIPAAISTDGGASFAAPVLTPMAGDARYPVRLSATAGLVFAVGGSPSKTRCWRTADAGVTWMGGGEVISFQTLRVLSPQVVLLVGQKTIQRSADGGQSWQTVLTLNNQQGTLSTVIPIGDALEVISNQHRWRSVDAGATWTAHPETNSPLQNGTCVLIPGGPALIRTSSAWYRSLGTYPYDPFTAFAVPQGVDVAAPVRAYVKAR